MWSTTASKESRHSVFPANDVDEERERRGSLYLEPTAGAPSTVPGLKHSPKLSSFSEL